MKFKVYYRDGSTYMGPPENTPILDVVLILEEDQNHGRRLVQGGDFYIWDDNRWIAGDKWSMISYMQRPGFNKRFLVGVMVDFETWTDFVQKAEADQDFPKRNGQYHREF